RKSGNRMRSPRRERQRGARTTPLSISSGTISNAQWRNGTAQAGLPQTVSPARKRVTSMDPNSMFPKAVNRPSPRTAGPTRLWPSRARCSTAAAGGITATTAIRTGRATTATATTGTVTAITDTVTGVMGTATATTGTVMGITDTVTAITVGMAWGT